MKKLILISMWMLVSTGAIGGVCNNASLNGAYNYQMTGVYNSIYSESWSSHDVGRINFNGAGKFSISGYWSQAGSMGVESAAGTYTVTSACLATGTIYWAGGVTTKYALYLDQMDGVPAVNFAYHGTVITSEAPSAVSTSGSITRVVGKF